MSGTKTTDATSVEIDLRKCTGCGICVEFCNHGVLALVGGHAEVVGLDKCTGCRLCEIRCPEPAILVRASKE
jgi:NAD-dependent dihydropyrimidine dehydrogenase PreA subunit